MKLSTRQKEILFGMVLGDAYVQKTGKNNSRLRLEHSLKQKDYIDWKYNQFQNVFQSKPVSVKRVHPKTKRMYEYLRLQSHSSPVFGKLQKTFYNTDGKKILPENLQKILMSPLTIAVWYMDDGYYDKRDKSALIYLHRLADEELDRLVQVFYQQHDIVAKWYCRPDKQACQLNFTGKNKDRLMELINPYLVSSMRYKTPLDPVTTEDENNGKK